MSRKRKTESTRLDEVDKTLYSTFCSAANSLSQLYTQAMNQQKISFQAGERHGMEKLYQWIRRKHEEGSRLSVAEIIAHIQNEMDYAGDDAHLVAPRSPFQHQHQNQSMHAMNSGMQPPSGFLGQPTIGLATRSGHFSNALSSPERRSLQPFQFAQGGGFYANSSLPAGQTGSRNHDPSQNRDTNSASLNDSLMDSPPRESY
ncbi:hypothetical protein Cni_G11702 [Canna indica]|uniref:Holocarboxylase synthetase n=1 Tax=Canna indica TaxID=4628 RepID=A0AAQ3K6T2_9LILI|nr:hypothetical protein Cni_G11702 [Canna indica]